MKREIRLGIFVSMYKVMNVFYHLGLHLTLGRGFFDLFGSRAVAEKVKKRKEKKRKKTLKETLGDMMMMGVRRVKSGYVRIRVTEFDLGEVVFLESWT